MSETFLKFTIKTLGQFSQFSDFIGKFERVFVVQTKMPYVITVFDNKV